MVMKKYIQQALDNLKNAYTPYSHYDVSAVAIMKSGNAYPGVNVENAAYGVTLCAERNAIFSAVTAGERELDMIVLVGGKNAGKGEKITEYCVPCGSCRQAMREFGDPEKVRIISAKSVDDYKEFTLAELLPESFGPEWLL